MAFEVAVWNSKDSWGDQERYEKALEHVKRIDADVVVLPEAYAEDADSEAIVRSKAALESEGYEVFPTPYGDTDGRRDRHFLMMLSRLKGNFAVLDLGTRQAIKLQMSDESSEKSVSLYGVHLDDRRESTRLKQTRAVVADHLRANADNIWTEKAIVVMGDLNALHRDAPDAGLLRSSRYITRWLPSVEPG